MPKDVHPPPSAPSPSPSLAEERAAQHTALLIVDMISCWDFADAEQLRPFASGIADAIARLKANCVRAGIPAIYCNDNRGRWRSDFRTLVHDAQACKGQGADIARRLAPEPDDYFVLKPMHSIFFQTTLALLLEHLDVRRVILTGVASDQCIMASAMEARMRRLEVVIAADAVASQSVERNDAALKQFREVHKLDVTPVKELGQAVLQRRDR
jgi:nicotinamidase-related amidase